MATDEWGMLRDIFAAVADEQFARANAMPTPDNPTDEARMIARYTVAEAFERAAGMMTARGGMTPDELAASIREMFPRPTKDVDVSDDQLKGSSV